LVQMVLLRTLFMGPVAWSVPRLPAASRSRASTHSLLAVLAVLAFSQTTDAQAVIAAFAKRRASRSGRPAEPCTSCERYGQRPFEQIPVPMPAQSVFAAQGFLSKQQRNPTSLLANVGGTMSKSNSQVLPPCGEVKEPPRMR
jgi:hypothetical protein